LATLPAADGLHALCRLPAAAVGAALGGTPAGAAAAAVAAELDDIVGRVVVPLAAAPATARWFNAAAGASGAPPDAPPPASAAAAAAAAAATAALRDAFLYAHAVVDSRAFRLPLRGGPGLALVPLADMGDHGPPDGAAAKVIDPSTGAFQLLAPAAASAPPRGTPVWLHYGRLDNLQLLLFYGFCVRDNPADGVEVVLDATALTANDDAGVAMKKEILLGAVPALGAEHTLTDRRRRPSDGAACGAGGGTYLPPGLLPSLRLLAASAAALDGVTVGTAAAALAAPAAAAADEARLLATLDGQLGDLEAALPPPPPPPPPPGATAANGGSAGGGGGGGGGDGGSGAGALGWLADAARVYVDGLRRVLGGARDELRALAAAAAARERGA